MCIAAAALASLRGRRHRIAAAALPKQGARGRVQSPTRRRRGSLALQPAGRSSSLPSQGLVAGGGVQLFVAVAGAPCRRRGRRLVAGGRRTRARIRILSIVSSSNKQGYGDTPRIRIPAVSQAYPYRIRIRYGIRTYPAVSVFLSRDYG